MNEPSPRSQSVPDDRLDLATVKAEIRASLARRRSAGALALPGAFEADLRAASLSRVERLADIGAGVPELPRFRGPLRLAARLLARVVLYLARFLTSRQRECNYAVLNVLRSLHRGLARLEEEQARQFRQQRADLEQFLEQRLREHGRSAA
jgi:hypothetical protein